MNSSSHGIKHLALRVDHQEPSPGQEQHASKKRAVAFEAITEPLSENSGVKANEVISNVCTMNLEGNTSAGLNSKLKFCYKKSCRKLCSRGLRGKILGD